LFVSLLINKLINLGNLGKIAKATFGPVRIPNHLDDIVELVTGINELVRPSSIKPRMKKIVTSSNNHKELSGTVSFNDVSLGYIIPWSLRNMYKIPQSFPVNSRASIVLFILGINTLTKICDKYLFQTRSKETLLFVIVVVK
jgi:hypothetical protein